jgi:peptidoglycan-associated lipoprotein
MRDGTRIAAILVLSLAALAGTCRKQPVATTAPTTPESTKPETRTEVTEAFPSKPTDRTTSPVPDAAGGSLTTVLFAYDSDELDEASRQVLRANADWLRKNPNVPILVEGHCDERGTMKYNVALGQRRADTVRKYLGSLGADPARIRIISYGKERPADLGHAEDSWAKNRRAEFRTE